MSNITNKNRPAGGNQDILDDPQVIELLSKYTEEIRNRRIDPEEFIDNYGYQGSAREEILREMRLAVVLEHIYADEKQQTTQIFTPREIREITARITETIIDRLRMNKARMPIR